jgi:hypothetical protein
MNFFNSKTSFWVPTYYTAYDGFSAPGSTSSKRMNLAAQKDEFSGSKKILRRITGRPKANEV